MPKAGKLSLKEVRSKAKAGTLTPAAIRKLVEVDEVRSKPFRPVLKFNAALVDLGGQKPEQDEIAKLLKSAATAAKAATPPAAKPKIMAAAKKAKQIRVLAEGDSWFDLPDIVYPRDAMDYLGETHDVLNIAKWGAELVDMVGTPQYRVPLKSGNFRHFFFSGGGNDVLASIGKYVEPFRPGDSEPAKAPTYINNGFDNALKRAMKFYAQVAADTNALAGVTLYVHGYANAIPVAGRKYLGKPFADLGFDPASALARAIVATMIDRFNGALQALAAQTARMVYVDLRPHLGANDWNWDEIHPNAGGARKIANRFRAAILANTPVA